MDAKTTGRFLAELRKEKGYTQKELGDKLMVTDKAISRWETGKGLPDTALLKPLSEILGVSVGELLAGKRVPPEQAQDCCGGCASFPSHRRTRCRILFGDCGNFVASHAFGGDHTKQKRRLGFGVCTDWSGGMPLSEKRQWAREASLLDWDGVSGVGADSGASAVWRCDGDGSKPDGTDYANLFLF